MGEDKESEVIKYFQEMIYIKKTRKLIDLRI